MTGYRSQLFQACLKTIGHAKTALRAIFDGFWWYFGVFGCHNPGRPDLAHPKIKKTGPAVTYQGIEAQLFRKDVLVHAGTGLGKTAIAAGPHVHEKSKGKVTFMVSPLIALQEEQVETFKTEFKLSAIVVNSTHGGCIPAIMTKICHGTWQIVILSPEMLLSKKFIGRVLRNPEMANRILSVVIDEAHVISHWGSGFRKNDLDFLIPNGISEAAQIPKTFIYADNISVGVEIEDHLYKCCADWEQIRGLEIIRPYSAAYSVEYCARVMELFKAGDVRILICTNAAGMSHTPQILLRLQLEPTKTGSIGYKGGHQPVFVSFDRESSQDWSKPT
ncbi:P-loop containing nucleoside triphosphate hydrolase protein [Infundibulicybe gibba]|nr:P-loop containing nucleoside triphosphate hydrolase protein [Infundibulicybe gibba]